MKDKQVQAIADANIRCHVCGEPSVVEVPGFGQYRRVTSDCRPWSTGGQLGVCQACGCVQKATDGVWQAEAEKIYDAYSIYHQSEGTEQAVFEEDSGCPSSRSGRLLERLHTHVRLPETGRLLDVGCGNGALLRAFERLAPSWSLAGTELTDKHRATVESIDRVVAFYTCTPDQVPGRFDLITMVHVLEHIVSPTRFLVSLQNRLQPGGLLVVEIPWYELNPFDLLIADHCTHFTAATMTALIQAAGYELLTVADDWVPKELTVVARRVQHPDNSRPPVSAFDSLRSTVESLRWLESVVAAAREIASSGTFGLFGTSIAATWLFSEMEGSISFFVDEDQFRAGRAYMGRPIYHPRDVPRDSHVFIALPTRFAEAVGRRIAKPDITLHLPPPYASGPQKAARPIPG